MKQLTVKHDIHSNNETFEDFLVRYTADFPARHKSVIDRNANIYLKKEELPLFLMNDFCEVTINKAQRLIYNNIGKCKKLEEIPSWVYEDINEQLKPELGIYSTVIARYLIDTNREYFLCLASLRYKRGDVINCARYVLDYHRVYKREDATGTEILLGLCLLPCIYFAFLAFYAHNRTALFIVAGIAIILYTVVLYLEDTREKRNKFWEDLSTENIRNMEEVMLQFDHLYKDIRSISALIAKAEDQYIKEEYKKKWLKLIPECDLSKITKLCCYCGTECYRREDNRICDAFEFSERFKNDNEAKFTERIREIQETEKANIEENRKQKHIAEMNIKYPKY